MSHYIYAYFIHYLHVIYLIFVYYLYIQNLGVIECRLGAHFIKCCHIEVIHFKPFVNEPSGGEPSINKSKCAEHFCGQPHQTKTGGHFKEWHKSISPRIRYVNVT